MNQENQPVPKQTIQKNVDHEYEVLPNGDVKVTQKAEIEFIWAPRDFLSLIRQNEQALENTRKSMDEEHIKKMQEQEQTILKEIEKLKPIQEESEKLAKIAYDKQLLDGLTDSIKVQLQQKEFNENWWMNIWVRTKQERKDQVMAKLTSDEKNEVAKAVQKLKRKGLIK